MQAISHATGTFAPIRASNTQRHTAQAVAEPVATQPLQITSEKSSGVWEKDSFSFWDIIDVINPLQHIPVISTIYRKITGDEMGYASRIAGDTLYGGMLGSLISSLVSAVANVFIDSTTGKDIGEHVVASIIPPPTNKSPANQATVQSAIQTTTQIPVQQMPQAPTSASITKQSAITLPPRNVANVQAGIDQYKWQTMADELKIRSNYWG